MNFRYIITIALAAVLASATIHAQDVEWDYTDGDNFPLLGKAVDDGSPRYQRLPDYLKGKVRDRVWALGTNSAGMCIRFGSDSPAIKVRWTSLYKNLMPHMTPVGTRGVDLYILKDGEWRFAGAGKPLDKTTDAVIVSGMTSEPREYMLYLSLYDGIEDVEIGIGKGYSITQPAVDSPSRKRPVVAYGTSILQGGCANRPGMAHTNKLERVIDREVINLGFSGNALLDYEIAELMAKVEDPGLYILDYVPNAFPQQIDERGERFFRIIRDAHPDVPVIFIEDPIFPHSEFDRNIRKEIEDKNSAQKALFQKLKKAGEKRIYYIPAEGMLGDDGEATVDGIHFTDLGTERYIRHILPTIRKALRKR